MEFFRPLFQRSHFDRRGRRAFSLYRDRKILRHMGRRCEFCKILRMYRDQESKLLKGDSMTAKEAIIKIEGLVYDSVLDSEQLIEAIKAILNNVKE